MKRTDDFLADLEAQLGAAAAGALPRARRRPSFAVLRPALAFAVAAAAVTAFVLAAGTDPDPERAAQPPAVQSGGPFTLAMAHHGQCAIEPGRAELPSLSVLDRPVTGTAASTSPFARTARADLPVTVVPRADVGPCVFDGDRGPGACVVVSPEGSEVKTACWSREDIDAGRAAAGLGAGFVVALLPDRFEQVTFVVGDERDTYAVTDNVVVGNLANAKEGVSLEMVPGTAEPAGCADGTLEDGAIPGEVLVAVPVLARETTRLPDHVHDALARSGATRIWADAHRMPADRDAAVWVVAVADSRFAECGDERIEAPRAWEGPGACLVGTFQAKVVGVLCSDLDDLTNEFALADVPGGRLMLAFQPFGAHSLDVNGTSFGGVEPARGVFAGVVAGEGGLDFEYRTVRGEKLGDPLVAVLGDGAQEVRERLEREGVTTGQVGDHPPLERTRVMYAAGLASSARVIAEMLRAGDVVPLDPATVERAGPQAGVVVVTGEDLRP